MNYDFKVFGKVMRGLRAVNVEIVLFCIAGIYNLLTLGFDVWQGLAFLPFLAIFFIHRLYFKFYPVTYDEMDWEQQYQFLKNNKVSSKRRPNALWNLENRFLEKYHGDEKFVEAQRFFFPFAVILIALIFYAVFGFSEGGFNSSRFF